MLSTLGVLARCIMTVSVLVGIWLLHTSSLERHRGEDSRARQEVHKRIAARIAAIGSAVRPDTPPFSPTVSRVLAFRRC